MKTKKRLLGILLTLVLVLGLMPGMSLKAHAAAVSTGQLYVAGVDIVSAGGTISSTTSGVTGVTGGTAVLDDTGANPVLTLTDFSFSGDGSTMVKPGAIFYTGSDIIDIVLVGNNELNITDPNNQAASGIYGIYTQNRIICSGNGTLRINAGACAEGSYGIRANYGVIINSGSINIVTGASSDNYSCALSAYNTGGDGIVINGGTVSVSSQAGKWKTNAFDGKLKNSIMGRGWVSTDGSGNYGLIETVNVGRTVTYAVAEFPFTLHNHSFTYSASGATITATCGGTGTCDITEGLTLTISAPTGSLVYDGTTTYPATLSTGYNTTAFPDTYSISYTKDGSAYSGVPKDAGTYTASVTAGTGDAAKTASVSYTIAKAAATVTKAPTAKPLPKTGDTSAPFLWIGLVLLGMLGLGISGLTYANRRK